MDSEFLTVRETCAHLRISRSFLYKLLRNGDLPSARIGRARRIPRQALTRFAEGRVRAGI